MTVANEETPTLGALIDRLAKILERRAFLFARVGGELLLTVVDNGKFNEFAVRRNGDRVEIVAGRPAAPIVHIGVKTRALQSLIDGTLDVPDAFQNRRLAVEGDLSALARFAECFQPSKSSLAVRSST